MGKGAGGGEDYTEFYCNSMRNGVYKDRYWTLG
jgi:hypothetical protein